MMTLQRRMLEYFEIADRLPSLDPHIVAAAIRWSDAVACQNYTAAQSWAKGIEPTEFRRVLKLMRYVRIAMTVVELPVDQRIPALITQEHYVNLDERDAIELDTIVRTLENVGPLHI